MTIEEICQFKSNCICKAIYNNLYSCVSLIRICQVFCCQFSGAHTGIRLQGNWKEYASSFKLLYFPKFYIVTRGMLFPFFIDILPYICDDKGKKKVFCDLCMAYNLLGFFCVKSPSKTGFNSRKSFLMKLTSSPLCDFLFFTYELAVSWDCTVLEVVSST